VSRSAIKKELAASVAQCARLQRSLVAAANDCAIYVEALRTLLARYDETVAGKKSAWTEEDRKAIEAIRALTVF